MPLLPPGNATRIGMSIASRHLAAKAGDFLALGGQVRRSMSTEKGHRKNVFGGMALALLVVEGATGIFLAIFYDSHLSDAYRSVQALYKNFPAFGAWTRDAHRWTALFLFLAVIVHMVRSLVRGDHLKTTKRAHVVWLSGGGLLLPLGALLVTGFILPWDWKAYWTMEMIPNYAAAVPVIGPYLKRGLIDAFSLQRNFVAHVVILPVISAILLDMHVLVAVRGRKGGMLAYLARRGLTAFPVLIVITILAIYVPMPTKDPEVLPSQLAGLHFPAPEWLLLVFFVPFRSFDSGVATLLGLLLPLVVYLGVTFLPLFLKHGARHADDRGDGAPRARKESAVGKILRRHSVQALGGFLAVAVPVAVLCGGLYSLAHGSPNLGCNACHNISRGSRMGVPPATFKDRKAIPRNDDVEWMVEHRFHPQRWSFRTTRKP